MGPSVFRATVALLFGFLLLLLSLPSQLGDAFAPSSVSNVIRSQCLVGSKPSSILIHRNPPKEQQRQGGTRTIFPLWGTTRTSLSRPERKALERIKKKQSVAVAQRTQQTGSRSVRQPLPNNCTVSDILRRLKRRNPTENLGVMEQRLRHLLLLFNEDDAAVAVTNSTAWAQLAIAALYQQQNQLHHQLHDNKTLEHLIHRCLDKHKRAMKQEIVQAMTNHNTLDPQQSSAIPLIRALMSQNRTDTAWHIWEQLQSPPQREKTNETDDKTTTTAFTIDISNAALSTIATYHFRRFEPHAALKALSWMVKGSMAVEPQRWIRLAQAAAACQSQLRQVHIRKELDDTDNKDLPPNVVHSVLMARFRTDPSYLFDDNPSWYEIVQNALVRRVVFVTGAVNLAGCPDRGRRGEACFIGRSNVGKSSLVNLLTNRKSLAYTSKRPGKTQQFNYFSVNDKPGLEKVIQYGDDVKGRADRDCFYIVDVPGFGYAAVPEAIRDTWKDFWHQYCTQQRPTVIFHLIDGRHGPTVDDISMSQKIREMNSTAKYVVVLTKVDKNGKFQVSDSVQKAVREAMPENTPVVWTSAERRWGFDVLWKYLQTAVVVTTT